MLIKNWMSHELITVDVGASMLDAGKLLSEHKIKFLPVTRSGKLAGVITDRDIKRASASDATSLEIHELLYLVARIKIGDIMAKPPVTVYEDHTVEEAAQLMLDRNISGLPVLDREGRLKGVITQRDLFKVIVSLTGLKQRGVTVALLLEDKSGSIKEAADQIRGAGGGRMASILTSYEDVPDGYRKVYIRMYGMDRSALPELKRKLKENYRLLYVVDLVDEKREIFE